MAVIKKNWWKIMVLLIVGMITWIISRKIIPTISIFRLTSFGKNYIGKSSLIIPVSIGYIITVLTFFSIVFVFVQKNLNGKKLIKGFKFGLAVAILWSIGFMEAHHFLGKVFFDGFGSAAADAVPFIITGLMCGVFFGSDNSQKIKITKKTETIATILLFSFLFGI